MERLSFVFVLTFPQAWAGSQEHWAEIFCQPPRARIDMEPHYLPRKHKMGLGPC